MNSIVFHYTARLHPYTRSSLMLYNVALWICTLTVRRVCVVKAITMMKTTSTMKPMEQWCSWSIISKTTLIFDVGRFSLSHSLSLDLLSLSCSPTCHLAIMSSNKRQIFTIQRALASLQTMNIFFEWENCPGNHPVQKKWIRRTIFETRDSFFSLTFLPLFRHFFFFHSFTHFFYCYCRCCELVKLFNNPIMHLVKVLGLASFTSTWNFAID